MLFNSLVFLYLFLPVTYLVFWQLKTKEQRFVWLTLTGYGFYSFWNYKFCLLMLLSTVVSYGAGRALARFRDPRLRRLVVAGAIGVDLSVLGFFKYMNFGLEGLNSLAAAVGAPFQAPLMHIVLPVGISFYTFHTISYVVDAYRGQITPTRNFFEFSCYVSLFAQLVAGPIVRFRQVEADLENLDHPNRREWLRLGWMFLVIGLCKKVVIADTIAGLINPGFSHYASLTTLDAWLCMVGYTYQLYFDFSGYSDMAVGLAYLFGIRLPQNFNSPYKALDISDFWRRWHISLSTFLRDYLYIPLGGNRGTALAVNRNLMITMLLGGLWHGANWTFLFWGGYHGALLVLHRAVGAHWGRLPVALQAGGTFLAVLVGWVFFRADHLGMAMALLKTMFTWQPGTTLAGGTTLAVLLLAVGAIVHLAPNSWQLRIEWTPWRVGALASAFVGCLFLINVGKPSPFLYFQF